MLLETDLIYIVHNSMHLEMVTALIYILPKSHTHACYVPRTWAVLDCPRLQPLQLFVHLFIGVTPSSALTQQNKRYAHSSYSLVHKSYVCCQEELLSPFLSAEHVQWNVAAPGSAYQKPAHAGL